jgi:hypothetical protein
MMLRPHRRNLVVWTQSAGPGGGYRPVPVTRARRIRRRIRIGVLLIVLGLMSVSRPIRARWRPVLAGVALTVAGLILRHGPGGILLLPGLFFLVAALLTPGRPDEDSTRRSQLERELALYSTPAQRSDLEATLDQYPDRDTHELRDILARQAMSRW